MAHPNFCISRVDNPSSHGWMVRVARGSEKIVKFFNDVKFGGKRLAQQAAKNFRDETINRLNREGKRPRIKKLVARQKRNRSGVIGVTRVERTKPDGTKVPYYSVTWHPQPGVQRGTSISILKYGEALAFKKACAIRNRQLMRRFGSGVFRKLRALRDEKPSSEGQA